MGPDVSRSVETVVGRNVLIWVPPADLRIGSCTYSLKMGFQETLLQKWVSEAGKGR